MSKERVNIRVGSVPEHFMTPWHLGMEDDSFHQSGIHIEWRDFPGGTGAMSKALEEDRADVCILLTEGIIKAIAEGNPSHVISGYIVSPIIWGIHTGFKNSLNSSKDIFDKRFAISRYGSGSHLIPQVDALTHEANIDPGQFTVVNDVEGALMSLAALETDVFYWEKYTTQPYVDNGQLRRIGEFITPWPCFVIAARDAFIKEHPESLKKMLEVIFAQNRKLMSDPGTVALIADRQKLKAKDVERWMYSTVWADHPKINPKMVSNVIYSLMETGLINHAPTYSELVWES